MKLWKVVVLVALLCGASMGAGRFLFAPEPLPPVITYLPSETITVIEDSQMTLDALAAERAYNRDLRISGDKLLDENGRLLRTVEILTTRTDPAPPPEREPIIKIIREACEEDAPPDFKAELDASKFEGLDDRGVLSYGWRGQIKCWMGHEGRDWGLAHAGDFSLTGSYAVTSEPPEPPRKPQRWYATLGYAVLRDETDFDYYQFTPDRVRISAGRRLFPLKPWSPHLGVFGSSETVGVEAGLSW